FWAHTTGTVLRSLRYFIAVIPLLVVMIGIVLARRDAKASGPAHAPRRSPAHMPFARLVNRGSIGGLAAAAVLALTVPAGFKAITNPSINGGLAYAVQSVVNRGTLTHQQLL